MLPLAVLDILSGDFYNIYFRCDRRRKRNKHEQQYPATYHHAGWRLPTGSAVRNGDGEKPEMKRNVYVAKETEPEPHVLKRNVRPHGDEADDGVNKRAGAEQRVRRHVVDDMRKAVFLMPVQRNEKTVSQTID